MGNGGEKEDDHQKGQRMGNVGVERTGGTLYQRSEAGGESASYGMS